MEVSNRVALFIIQLWFYDFWMFLQKPSSYFWVPQVTMGFPFHPGKTLEHWERQWRPWSSGVGLTAEGWWLGMLGWSLFPQYMDVGQNGRPRGPQMWMSSLVLTIQLLRYLILTHTQMFRAPIKLVMTWGWFMALPHPEWIDDIDDPQHDWIKSCIIHLLTKAHLIHYYDYSIFWHHIQSKPHEFLAVSPVKKHVFLTWSTSFDDHELGYTMVYPNFWTSRLHKISPQLVIKIKSSSR